MNPMETAPRDGTPIRLFAKKYGPPEGIVAWSGRLSVPDGSPDVWVCPKGHLVFEFAGWEPIKSGETLPFALSDEQLIRLTE